MKVSKSQIEELIDGCALLERFENLYEYCGTINGRLLFQNVSDDSHITASYEMLLTEPEYTIQY